MWFIQATLALFFVSFCSAASILNINRENCTTPLKKVGRCIKLDQCEILTEMMRQEKLKSEGSLEFLFDYHCGFDKEIPKVCCENKEEEGIVNSIQKSRTQDEGPILNSPENPDSPDEPNHPNVKLINDDRCGSTMGKKMDLRIHADLFQFPWMALLVYRNQNNQNFEFQCGGSIINSRYVLTAAHCVTGFSNNFTLVGVRVGVHNLRIEVACVKNVNATEICPIYQDIFVECSHYHPQFSKDSKQNDIALLRLEKDIDFKSENVGTICLPIGSATNLQHEKVLISGWGVREYGTQSEELLKNILPLVPHDQCEKNYEGLVKIENSQICVGGENKMTSCIGDSGGPLQGYANYKNQIRYIQYGVFNFGNPMCLPESYPTVFTRVSYFIDWILDTIRE